MLRQIFTFRSTNLSLADRRRLGGCFQEGSVVTVSSGSLRMSLLEIDGTDTGKGHESFRQILRDVTCSSGFFFRKNLHFA
jgi:hypothetical protein